MATAIAARDAGLRAPRHVLSVYPVTQTSRNTESYLENAIAKPLNRAMMDWFFTHVTRSEAGPRRPAAVAGRCAAGRAGAGHHRQCAARSAAQRWREARSALIDAGVEVARKEFEGVAHEFFGAAAVLEKARDARASRASGCVGRSRPEGRVPPWRKHHEPDRLPRRGQPLIRDSLIATLGGARARARRSAARRQYRGRGPGCTMPMANGTGRGRSLPAPRHRLRRAHGLQGSPAAPAQLVIFSNFATKDMRERAPLLLGADAVFDKSTEIEGLLRFLEETERAVDRS